MATGIQKTIDVMTGETQRAERARLAGDLIEKLGDLMSANKIRARDPQAIQQFIQQVTDESDVEIMSILIPCFDRERNIRPAIPGCLLRL